jgi:hypothetical protein
MTADDTTPATGNESTEATTDDADAPTARTWEDATHLLAAEWLKQSKWRVDDAVDELVATADGRRRMDEEQVREARRSLAELEKALRAVEAAEPEIEPTDDFTA